MTGREFKPGAAEATFAAYIRATNGAWKTFMRYQHGEASEAEVGAANRAEARARSAHERALAASSEDVTA